jgi:C1A family cysteine protease
MPSYGWKPDTPDQRDRYRAAPAPGDLPPAVDLRPFCPPVYDQGDLGSCTANAIAAAVQYDQAKQGFPIWMPSRLFIYYNERVMEDCVGEDAGAMIRDGIKSLNQHGVCYEELWPYDPARFAERPPPTCYEVAKNHPSVRYARVRQYADHIKGALAHGDVIVFGMTVYESFESDAVAHAGLVPYPERGERPVGGHCMLAVGYEGNHVVVRNSWGPHWGTHGYCLIPIDYLCSTDLADDFWTVAQVA